MKIAAHVLCMPVALVLAPLAAPAQALDRAADGKWECRMGTIYLGELDLAGEAYVFEGSESGELVAGRDGVTYDVVSGFLRTARYVQTIVHDPAASPPVLNLHMGGGERLAVCLRID